MKKFILAFSIIFSASVFAQDSKTIVFFLEDSSNRVYEAVKFEMSKDMFEKMLIVCYSNRNTSDELILYRYYDESKNIQIKDVENSEPNVTFDLKSFDELDNLDVVHAPYYTTGIVSVSNYEKYKTRKMPAFNKLKTVKISPSSKPVEVSSFICEGY